MSNTLTSLNELDDAPCYAFCNASLQEVKAGRANGKNQQNNATTYIHFKSSNTYS